MHIHTKWVRYLKLSEAHDMTLNLSGRAWQIWNKEVYDGSISKTAIDFNSDPDRDRVIDRNYPGQ